MRLPRKFQTSDVSKKDGLSDRFFLAVKKHDRSILTLEQGTRYGYPGICHIVRVLDGIYE